MRIQAPHVFAKKIKFPKIYFPACIGFVPGGTYTRMMHLDFESVMSVRVRWDRHLWTFSVAWAEHAQEPWKLQHFLQHVCANIILGCGFFAYSWKLLLTVELLGDRFLSSAGTGKNCALSMRFPDRSPVLDKNRAPMGPEILSSTGARAWRKAPMAFPDSSSFTYS